jgi:type II secretory pathway pseudopilin PulG
MTTPGTTPSLRAESGFTLVEMVVAMLSATIIMIAMVALLVFTTNQASRISERVQATRIGHVAMTRIIDELHSSCTGFGTDAVQGPSTEAPLESTGPTNLWLISAYGSSTSKEAVQKTVYEHDINWTATKKNASGEQLGTLADYSFESKSGTGPGTTAGKWEFPALKTANAKKTILATNVIPLTISGTHTLFLYYKLSGETGKFTQITEKIPTEAAANGVAKVSIGFVQAPEGTAGESKLARAAPFSDSVVLRLNPTETGEGIKDEPCS